MKKPIKKAIKPTSKQSTIPENEQCSTCEGSGIFECMFDRKRRKCHSCGGTGTAKTLIQVRRKKAELEGKLTVLVREFEDAMGGSAVSEIRVGRSSGPSLQVVLTI